ncbi:hypothetical protein, partial [Staphylococcus pseudintermedius]|uniref:hypothetical protein n=1 Tax=Staphylococcus pseudintermedius TaxID=283734 RepID=UPI0010D7E61F
MIDERDSKLIEIEKADAFINLEDGDYEEILAIEHVSSLNIAFKDYDAKFKVREAEILSELRSVSRVIEGE